MKAFSFLAQGSLRTSVVVERLSTLETWVRQSDELDPEGTKVLLISLGLGSTDPGRVRRATHYSNLFAGRIANVREQLKSSWPMSLPSTHQPKVAEAPAWLVRRMEALRQMPPPTLQEVDTQLKASAEARRKLIEQAGCLIEWARLRGVLLTEAHFTRLKKHESATAEHEVFFRDSDNRVVKRTYPGTFGVTPEAKGRQQHATPLFYLHRLDLMNRVFHSDLRMEGITLRDVTVDRSARDTCQRRYLAAMDPGSGPKTTASFPEGNWRFHEILGVRSTCGLLPRLVSWHRRDDGSGCTT